ncbi:MAG: SDR family NAD(P)-dependent oxidoreductase [Leptolyngbyaceae cyanobacterium MO_188.B28]|nr:SDR family NAD(P)-dependent oxidoreductase [Leptolyngbyaceae cyanobacterium MO_188.B28]
MTQLSNAVVLITGAAGGFGHELTRQLLAAGSQLILTDLDQAVLEARLETIQRQVKTGKVLACFAADLSSAEGCDALYNRVKGLANPVDILINNAGVGLFGRMDEIPSDKWEQLMQVNLMAPIRLSSLFAAEMIGRRQGHIVNISSLAGWVTTAGLTHYAASKFGLRGFSEGLFNDVKEYNVKVTVVYPFFSRTPILQSERYGSLSEDFQGVPENWITDPAAIMSATIQGIQRNQLHVFPDLPARSIHLLKRYFPWVSDRIMSAQSKRVRRGEK